MINIDKIKLYSTILDIYSLNKIFSNITFDYESCDCGNEFGCSHSDWIYQINIYSNEICV
jgi:hypothetical protein